MNKAIKILSLTGLGILLGGLIAGNVVCYINSGVITNALCGNGVSFEGENVEKASALGDELCKEMGKEGIVLLKNGTLSTSSKKSLPLDESVTKVNLFGYAATDNGFLLKGIGSGSSTINPDKQVTLLQAFKNANIEYNTEIIDAYNAKNWGSRTSKSYELKEASRDFYTNQMLSNAKSFSDTAIIVLSRIGGENMDEIPTEQTLITEKGSETDNTRTYQDTTKYEDDLIRMAHENFKNVIVIVNTCNTMHLGIVDTNNVDSAIYVGLTGQSAATAIPDILWGKVSPSGRVTDTYSYEPDTAPSYANRIKNGGHIQYVEDIYIGYKWYETADKEGYWKDIKNGYGVGYDGVVQYPFGYGLSYTSFEWEIESQPSIDFISKYTTFEYTINVTNTGTVKGRDVVEIYVNPPYKKGEIEKSSSNLVAFAKTAELEPGQTQKLNISFNAYDFASYDAYDKNKNGFTGYELDEGEYEVKFMTDAHNLKEMKNNTLKYKVDAGGITYKMDPKTKQFVKNRMTGENAYAETPIDGSTVGAEKQYLSRNDFVSTFPKVHAKTPNNNGKGSDFINDVYDTNTMPTLGVDSGLRIVTKEDGTSASLADLKGNGTKLVANEELIADLSNYKSETWEKLLNQMSADELCRLVEDGGFSTQAIESIGKPKALDTDGPAGFNANVLSVGGDAKAKWTAYPSETLIGSTWSSEIAYRMGLSMGVEAQATGMSGWYAPGVNLHRSPYTARNYEYYSEDGFISGKLAAEVIRGAKINGLYCYLKHFVLSEPGPNPRGLNTWCTEQNLRENYLKPFEIAVKEGGANAIMSAFNRVGGTWAGASYPCLTQILRTEWGFRGSVITDYSSGDGRGGMNPEQGVKAGNDFWLNPNEGNNKYKLDRTDSTMVTCARTAAKNVIFTYVDTYQYAKTHDAGDDSRYSVEVGVRNVESVFAWWIPTLIAIDVVAVLAIGLGAFFILKPKKLSTANGADFDSIEVTSEEELLDDKAKERKMEAQQAKRKKLEEEIESLKKTLKEKEEELNNLK